MKAEYNLKKMKSRKNPYAHALTIPVTLRLNPDVIAFFKVKAEKTGIPYQRLINLYLQDCCNKKRELKMPLPPK